MSKLYRTVHLPRKTQGTRSAFGFCPKCGQPFPGHGMCRRCRKTEHTKKGQGVRHV